MISEIRLPLNNRPKMRRLSFIATGAATRSRCSIIVFAVFAAVSALLLNPATAASGKLDPTGFWKTTKRDGVVEIFRCGSAYCGRVADAAILRKNSKQTDVNNPDPALRSRAIRGLIVLKNFTGGSGEWSGGPLYDPDTGDSAPRGRLRLRDAQTLEVRGCIALFLCRTQVWKRQAD